MEMEAIKQAQASAVVNQFDETLWAQVEDVVYQRRETQLLARAEAKLEPAYEEKFRRQCERWEDEHAGYKKTVQDEHDAMLEKAREQDRRRLRREFEEQLTEAKEAQAAAEQRLAAVDEQLLVLIKSLLPENKRPFLFDCGVETLDVWGLNHILQRQGLEIAHTRTESEKRLVKIRTGEAEWQAATRFWLQPYEAPEEPKVNGIPLKYIAKL
jgi:hypothetical protein